MVERVIINGEIIEFCPILFKMRAQMLKKKIINSA